MSDDPKHQGERDQKVGVFMAPDGLFTVPLKTLTDEIPTDERKPRHPGKPSWLTRTMTRLGRGGR